MRTMKIRTIVVLSVIMLFALSHAESVWKPAAFDKYYLEIDGKPATPALYDEVWAPVEYGSPGKNAFNPLGFAIVKTWEGWNVIDSTGTYILDKFYPQRPAWEGEYFTVWAKEGKYRYTDFNDVYTLNGILVDSISNILQYGRIPRELPENLKIYPHLSVGYEVFKTDDDGNEILSWTDEDLNPIFEEPIPYSRFEECGLVFTVTLGYRERDYPGVALYNMMGKETFRFDGRSDIIKLGFVTDKETEAYLKERFGGSVPPLVLVENAENPEKGDLYFLEEKICSDIKFKLKKKYVDTLHQYMGHLKKIFKKKLLPIIDSQRFIDKYNQDYVEAAKAFLAHNDSILSTREIKLDIKPFEVAERDGKYRISRNGVYPKYNTTLYSRIDTLNGFAYIAYNDSTFDILSRNGEKWVSGIEEIRNTGYKVGGRDLWMMSKANGKKNIFFEDNLENYSNAYDDIILNEVNGELGAYVCYDNGWGYYSLSNPLQYCSKYDYISDFNEEGIANVYYKGYQGKIDASGKKTRYVCQDLFNVADDEKYSPQDRIAVIDEMLGFIDDVGEGHFRGQLFNLAGEIYESAGDLESAKHNYDIARSHNYAGADANYKRVRNDIVINKLNAVADALNSVATALGGDASANYSTMQSSGFANWGDLSAGSAGGGEYEAQYRNWERRAKANYESLTNLGYRTTKDGKAKSGGAAGKVSGGNYVAQKRMLCEAQNEMSKIRQKAAKAGVTIRPSEYESVTVNF